MPIHRVMALGIAIAFYVLAWHFIATSAEDRLFFLVYNAFCILLIWYGDFIGGLSGTHLGDILAPRITRKTPGSVVRFVGWCLLIIPFLFMLAKRFALL